MIKELEKTPLKGMVFPEGKRKWLIKCDVCGRENVQICLWYEYGFGGSGYPELGCGGMKAIEYGEYNKRVMHICIEHKDAEIVKKILELT